MQIMLSDIEETVDSINAATSIKPKIGIVLGTGLNALIEYIKIEKSIPYTELAHFPNATVSFHKGQLIFGRLKNVPVVAMQGRFHYYEGYSMQQITFPIRVMKMLGVEHLLLSNAAGGMNPDYKKGDLIITDDHINLLPDNPLRGLGDEYGNRFTDMSRPYSPHLQILLQQAFEKQNIPVKIGTYVSVMGPNLETRAEYRWLRSMGVDMVGMSTVPEVIVANQLGIACAAISVITDECDPDNLQPINIEEIIEIAGKSDEKLSVAFAEVVRQLGNE